MLKTIVYWLVAGILVGVFTVEFSFLFVRGLIGDQSLGNFTGFDYGAVVWICVAYAIILTLLGLAYHWLFGKK